MNHQNFEHTLYDLVGHIVRHDYIASNSHFNATRFNHYSHTDKYRVNTITALNIASYLHIRDFGSQ